MVLMAVQRPGVERASDQLNFKLNFGHNEPFCSIHKVTLDFLIIVHGVNSLAYQMTRVI